MKVIRRICQQSRTAQHGSKWATTPRSSGRLRRSTSQYPRLHKPLLTISLINMKIFTVFFSFFSHSSASLPLRLFASIRWYFEFVLVLVVLVLWSCSSFALSLFSVTNLTLQNTNRENTFPSTRTSHFFLRPPLFLLRQRLRNTLQISSSSTAPTPFCTAWRRQATLPALPLQLPLQMARHPNQTRMRLPARTLTPSLFCSFGSLRKGL